MTRSQDFIAVRSFFFQSILVRVETLTLKDARVAWRIATHEANLHFDYLERVTP